MRLSRVNLVRSTMSKHFKNYLCKTHKFPHLIFHQKPNVKIVHLQVVSSLSGSSQFPHRPFKANKHHQFSQVVLFRSNRNKFREEESLPGFLAPREKSVTFHFQRLRLNLDALSVLVTRQVSFPVGHWTFFIGARKSVVVM